MYSVRLFSAAIAALSIFSMAAAAPAARGSGEGGAVDLPDPGNEKPWTGPPGEGAPVDNGGPHRREDAEDKSGDYACFRFLWHRAFWKASWMNTALLLLKGMRNTKQSAETPRPSVPGQRAAHDQPHGHGMAWLNDG
ncbi:hypothetical protein E4U53_001476 [Claviceps sorghi]|nr:hypothetical protein E4U53_001476 [Claviceps sorghi]